MASDPRIRNDLSIGIETRNLDRLQEQRNRLVPNSTRGSVTQMVAEYVQNMAAPGALYKFPFDTPKYYMTLSISDYKRSDFLNINFKTKETIILPLPTQIADKNDVSWSEFELGPLVGTLGNGIVNSVAASGNGWEPVAAGVVTAAGLAGGQAVGDSAVNWRQRRVQSALKGAKARGNARNSKQFLDGALTSQTVGGQLLGMFQAAAGFAPNQWLTVLMKGPKYKRYTYTWNLVPKNKEEAIAINRIVRTIQDAKCPELGIANAYWKFPSVFKLQFKPNDKYLFQFKPSVIEACEVYYSTGHDHAFYHGENGENPPEAVKLSISFLELEYWRKNDYLKGL